MKRSLLAVIVLVAIVIAVPACAGITVSQTVVPGGYAAGTLSYSNGQFLANSTSGEVISLAGTWQGQGGLILSRPVWTSRGIAGYDQQGYASLYDGTTLLQVTNSAQFSNPLIQPTSSDNGDIAYGAMMTHFLLVARPNGTTDGYLPFSSLGWSGSWWVTSAAFTPGGTMYVAGQNTATAVNNGYRVVGHYAGSFFDAGLSYSEIAYGGGMLWGITNDHRAVEAWSLDEVGSIGQKVVVTQGGYYNMLGGDQNGVMYKDATNIWYAQSSVPEPGSLLALGSGLLGLVGFGLRKRG